MSTYRISQLAERSGVPATTLRFYEDAGLLPAGRTPAGYRVYGEDAVERLGFISSAKLLGLALEEIRELLEVREQGVCAAVRTRMVPLVAGRIAESEGRIAELSAFCAHLAAVQADLSGRAPEGGCGPGCGCTTAPAASGPVPVPLSPTRTARAPDAWRDAQVACTLGGSELAGRTREWRRLVEQAESRTEIPDGLRLSFPATPDLAGRLATLAAAEQDCCSFYDFTLHLSPTTLELTVRAPAAAAPLLAELFGVTFSG
ncbi:heavy metal-responsive transcriptional regulator [Streptomyces niveus]|uniref:heavy metal-responsive transcriptional regulator n=1 Tax=Streptomyces niveus TaxID=193462 RepID=UPI0036DDC31A